MPHPKLYDYPASANCYKVRLLLEQLALPHEQVTIDIFDGDTLTDEYGLLNPFRSTPVWQLPDGRTLIESNAILWHLAVGSAFLPVDPFWQSEVCRWLIYEQSDVMATIGSLRFRLQTGRLAPESGDEVRRRNASHDVLRMIDQHLSTRTFLAGGSYSIADIAVFAYSHVAEEASIETSHYPNFLAWVGRVKSQPRFKNDLAPYPPNASAGMGRSIYG